MLKNFYRKDAKYAKKEKQSKARRVRPSASAGPELFTVSEPVELAGDFKYSHIIMFRTHLVFPDASWGITSSRDC